MRSLVKKMAIVLAVAAAGSCNWGTFDDLKGDSWAMLLDEDDSPTSGDFGIDVAAVTATGGAASFVITAGMNAGVAQATIDAKGDRTAFVGFDADGSGGGSLRPIKASTPPLAVVPFGASGYLVGAPGVPNVVEFKTGVSDPRSLFTGDAPARAGEALAVGDLGLGAAGANDVVVVGGTSLTVIPDGTGTPVSCQLVAPDKNGNVPVVPLENVKTARFESGTGPDQIVVGAKDAGGTPRIFILDAADVQGANGDLCPTSGIQLSGSTAPGSIAIGDVDGGGQPDIVAGTLGGGNDLGSVTVFLNPRRGQGAPAAMAIPTMSADGSSTLRGTRIRVANIDEDSAQEIIVGDALAQVNGNASVGQVQIYRWGGGAGCATTRGPACLVRTLYDPGAKSYFGRSLAVATFNGKNILAVGQKDQVVVYFRVSTAATDPRQ